MQIQSLSENHRKRIITLHRKKGRNEHQRALVEGWRAVEAAILGKAPLVEVLVSDETFAKPDVAELLEQAHLPVYRLPARDGKKLSSVEQNQGIIGIVEIESTPIDKLLQADRLLLLDGVQDPGNVGTMIRTAAWFGIDGIIAGPGTADLYNPKVVRASMGGLWDVLHARNDDPASLLQRCPVLGFSRYGADLEGTSLDEWVPESKGILVIGSEARGISPAVSSLLDQRVVISGSGHAKATESLNAAVAAGIILNRWNAALS